MEPVIAVDAGNTRIKWGVHDGRTWVSTGFALTRDVSTISRVLAGAATVRTAIVSNVAGPTVLAELQRAFVEAGIAPTVIRSEGEQLGVVNGYRDAGQLGSDRWASLIAAHGIDRGDKLVVNVGTALTVDALCGDGRFLGGLIVPGPALMRRSLDRGTAGLRLTEGDFRDFPENTPDAITSGAIQACIGAIGRLADAMSARDVPPRLAILSGGGAAEIAPHLPIPFAIHENLVLDGLMLIARDT
jgi:type III pantothenate kinase